jgi:PAS domain S-box-containing protein
MPYPIPYYLRRAAHRLRLQGPLAANLPAQLLHGLAVGTLLYIWLIHFPIILPLFVTRRAGSALLTGSLTPIYLGTLALLRRGRMRSASLVFLAGSWAVVTVLLVFSGGMAGFALIHYVNLPILAACLLGTGAAEATAAVCLVSSLVLAILQQSGCHLPNYFPNSPVAAWSSVAMSTLGIMVPIIAFFRLLNETGEKVRRANEQLEQRVNERSAELEEAYRKVQVELGERQRAEGALRRSRDELEDRVRQRTAELAEANRVLEAEVAEHRRAELQLSEQAALLDLARDAIMVLDIPSREILFWNQGAERTYGWPAREAVGRVATQLLKIQFPVPLEAIDAILQEKGEWEGDLQQARRDGQAISVASRASLQRDERGRPTTILVVNRDITDRQRAEDERRAHIHFLESLERVNQAIVQQTDVESMLQSALDATLSIFACDRAWLLFPCDPEAPSFRIPIEVFRPEYPGINDPHGEVPLEPAAAEILRALLTFEDPLTTMSRVDDPDRMAAERRFAIQSRLMLAIYPKTGQPWVFGLHQCSHPRLWTQDERELFKQIGRRVGDVLSNFLLLRDLRESEERYRTLFENSPVGIYRTTPAGRVLAGNPAFTRMLGYSTVAEMATLDLNAPGYEPEYSRRAFKERLEKEGQITGLESRWHRRDGRVIFVRENARVRRDAAGQIVCYEGTTEDITERKRVEEKAAQLAAIVESSDDAIVSKSLEGAIQSWNRGAVQVYGYEESEAVGRPPSLLVPPDRQGEIPEVLRRIRAGEHIRHFETVRRRKDGRAIDVSLTFSPVRDSAGNIVAVSAIARDITAQKEAERALRASSRYARSLIEASLDPMVTISPAGQITDVNAATEAATGYHRATLIGTDFADYFTVPERARAGWNAVFRDGQVRDYPLELRHRDGRVTLVLYHASLYRDEAGQVAGAITTGRDITERKRAQEELQRSFEQLRALAGRLQTIREEERKHVAREIHDQLGQVLTAIKLDFYSLVYEMGGDVHRPSERVTAILRLMDEAIRTVRRLSTELRPGILDDLGLVATIEWTVSEFSSRTGIRCHLDLPEESLDVGPETATAVFRILQETLTNVARHAAASDVEVRLAKEDGDLTLEVRDNGKGFSPDPPAHAKSLGILGMQERALLLGGELNISGVPGEGTTVRVRIPAGVRAPR